MGILEQILAELAEIKEAIASGGGAASDTTPPAKPKAGTAKPKDADKGPTLEEVQDLIRGLVGADADANKPLIKKAIKAIDKTAERAGDFEGKPAALKKLHAALTALSEDGGEEAEPEAEEDDDML